MKTDAKYFYDPLVKDAAAVRHAFSVLIKELKQVIRYEEKCMRHEQNVEQGHEENGFDYIADANKANMARYNCVKILDDIIF